MVRRLTTHLLETLDVDAIESVRIRDVFQEYKTCQIIFTRRQWAALIKVFSEGCSTKEAAAQLGIGASAVSALLARARERLEEEKREHTRWIIREKMKYLKEEFE
jgi:DNA-directed RNA polymerase specialized sigma24 family protein